MKQYIELVNKVINEGKVKENRTGINTRSLFGESLKFNLSDGFPICTTRKTFFRGAVIEFIWMVSRGDCNIKYLLENNVKFWSHWPYEKYLNSDKNDTIYSLNIFQDLILSSDEFSANWGSIGNGYGIKFRNYNGFDQVQNLIDSLKKDPLSRRNVLNLFDPNDHFDYNKCLLPPCHHETIWNSDGEYLNCAFTMRSNDVICGLPINICFYALFTHVIAHLTNLKPGVLLYNGIDVHIYENHIENYLEYVSQNEPKPLPTLVLDKVRLNNINTIEPDMFYLKDYEYHTIPKDIKFEVAI